MCGCTHAAQTVGIQPLCGCVAGAQAAYLYLVHTAAGVLGLRPCGQVKVARVANQNVQPTECSDRTLGRLGRRRRVAEVDLEG